ncbi:MAG: hypothetical protein LBI67_00160 [Treponema sp.]|nr:hypothetical protein [Treponema sp.]
MIRQEQEATAKKALDCAYEVHSRLGPGLLESACQACLLHEFLFPFVPSSYVICQAADSHPSNFIL